MKVLVVLLAALQVAVAAAAGGIGGVGPDSLAGASIYRDGRLLSGAPLQGVRQGDGPRVEAAGAACVNCHRHSGLGAHEGGIWIPPVTGSYLFQPRAPGMDQPGLHYVEGAKTRRTPYTDLTLARAIREGADPDGRTLDYLMPRFALADADMAALIAYLRALDPPSIPGVTPTVLHFATIVTPDADPVGRAGMLDVLRQYFDDKNAFPFGPSPPMHTSATGLPAKSMYKANRRWQLHVWQLEGPPSGWGAQLERDLAREPVLAVLSGLGGPEWGPVHEFCERRRLPCLFPNVEVPPAGERDFYSVYLSRGVLLEAGLIADRLLAPPQHQARVVQLFRRDDSGEAAAAWLGQELRRHGQLVQDRALPANATEDALRAELGDLQPHDRLVLWLRPADLAALDALRPATDSVYLSGLMGGLDDAPLSHAWRLRATMAYPVDLPERRVVRVDFPMGWFAIRHIAVVAPKVQVDTYLACSLLAETVNHLADNFVPEYLVERLEELVDQRLVTGYYPRLSLAPGQQFASKGGYLVRFAGDSGTRLLPDGGWTVP